MQLELVDKDIDPNEYDAEEAKKIIEIALLCTQASAAMRSELLEHMRPSMQVIITQCLN